MHNHADKTILPITSWLSQPNTRLWLWLCIGLTIGLLSLPSQAGHDDEWGEEHAWLYVYPKYGVKSQADHELIEQYGLTVTNPAGDTPYSWAQWQALFTAAEQHLQEKVVLYDDYFDVATWHKKYWYRNEEARYRFMLNLSISLRKARYPQIIAESYPNLDMEIRRRLSKQGELLNALWALERLFREYDAAGLYRPYERPQHQALLTLEQQLGLPEGSILVRRVDAITLAPNVEASALTATIGQNSSSTLWDQLPRLRQTSKQVTFNLAAICRQPTLQPTGNFANACFAEYQGKIVSISLLGARAYGQQPQPNYQDLSPLLPFAEHVQTLSLLHQPIASLKGIQRFPKLRELYLDQLPQLSQITLNNPLPQLTIINAKQLPELQTVQLGTQPQLQWLHFILTPQLNLATIPQLPQLQAARLESATGIINLNSMPSQPELIYLDYVEPKLHPKQTPKQTNDNTPVAPLSASVIDHLNNQPLVLQSQPKLRNLDLNLGRQHLTLGGSPALQELTIYGEQLKRISLTDALPDLALLVMATKNLDTMSLPEDFNGCPQHMSLFDAGMLPLPANLALHCLEKLAIGGGALDDLSSLNGATKLHTLDVYFDSPPQSLSSLPYLPSLQQLTLHRQAPQNLHGLRNAPNLHTLTISELGDVPLSTLPYHPGIRVLEANLTRLSSFAGIERLPNLEKLWLIQASLPDDFQRVNQLCRLRTLGVQDTAFNYREADDWLGNVNKMRSLTSLGLGDPPDNSRVARRMEKNRARLRDPAVADPCPVTYPLMGPFYHTMGNQAMGN